MYASLRMCEKAICSTTRDMSSPYYKPNISYNRKITLVIIDYTYNYNTIIMYSAITLIRQKVIRMVHQGLDVEIIDDIIEYTYNKVLT